MLCFEKRRNSGKAHSTCNIFMIYDNKFFSDILLSILEIVLLRDWHRLHTHTASHLFAKEH